MLQCSTSPLVLPHLKGWTVTSGASLGAQRLKRLPPMWETQVRSLGQEDPLEKEMVTHSSILAWRIPWTEKPGRLQSMGSQRVGHDWATSLTYLQSHLTSSIYWRLQLCTLRLIFLFSCFSFYFVETFQPDSLFFISYSPQIPNFVSYVCCAKSLQSCPTLCDRMDCM